jgi:hypothetical protein
MQIVLGPVERDGRNLAVTVPAKILGLEMRKIESRRVETRSAFLAAENVASYALLERKAASNPEWFWDALIRFLGLKFIKPYSRVLDQTRSRIR